MYHTYPYASSGLYYCRLKQRPMSHDSPKTFHFLSLQFFLYTVTFLHKYPLRPLTFIQVYKYSSIYTHDVVSYDYTWTIKRLYQWVLAKEIKTWKDVHGYLKSTLGNSKKTRWVRKLYEKLDRLWVWNWITSVWSLAG